MLEWEAKVIREGIEWSPELHSWTRDGIAYESWSEANK